MLVGGVIGQGGSGRHALTIRTAVAAKHRTQRRDESCGDRAEAVAKLTLPIGTGLDQGVGHGLTIGRSP